MIVLLFDTDSFGHKAVSNLWFFGEPFGATLWEPLENRFSNNRTPPRVPRPWLDWKFHYCGKNFWQTSFCKKMLCEKLLSSSDPHPYTLFWHSFWHTFSPFLSPLLHTSNERLEVQKVTQSTCRTLQVLSITSITSTTSTTSTPSTASAANISQVHQHKKRFN